MIVSLTLVAARSADPVVLTVDKGPGPDEVTLSWSAGEGTFEIFRSTQAPNLLDPANKLGETVERILTDSPPPEETIFFYNVVGGSLLEPPTATRPPAEPCDCEGSCPQEVTPGHSVYPFSGEFYLEAVDLQIKGRGLDFIWARKYRSGKLPYTRMGRGWDFSYNMYIEQDGQDIRLFDGNTREDLYRRQPNGTWARDGLFRELSQEANGTYRLNFADTSQWNFHALDGSATAGNISSILDRNGNTLSFAYDAAGRLTAVTDTLGRNITIAYNAGGFIETVTDLVGRQVKYAYYPDGDPGGSFGNLKSVTTPAVTGTPNGNDFPAGKTRVYVYSTGFGDGRLNHNLLRITDPKGQTYLENTYASTTDPNALDFDRIVRQVWGDPGDIIDFVYVPQDAATSPNGAVIKAILNDRVGDVKEYLYDGRNRMVAMREYTGRAPDPDQPTTQTDNRPTGKLRTYDPDFFETRHEYNRDSLRTRSDYPNGNIWRNVYESDLDPNAPRRSRGNLREVHREPGPLGGDQAEIVELFEYDTGMGGCCGTNFVIRHVDGRGNQTLHSYDARGNRLHTQHRIPAIVEDFEYNGFGQMTAHLWPDNGSTHRRRDESTYHPSGPQMGYLHREIIDAPGFALTTAYEYDAVGNVTRKTDPRGHDTQYIVNQLDQVVREISREVTDGSGVRYQRDTFFDANENVVRTDIQNTDDAGVLQPNTHFTVTSDYEILNRVIRTTEEVDEAHSVVTEYAYDANRNRTLVRYGEATTGQQPTNVLRTLYDERDLLFRTIRAEGDPLQSSTQQDYDGNRNLKAVRRGLEGVARVTGFTYDGYNRLVTQTDAMGNVTTNHYDANGKQRSRRVEGELTDVGGGAGNVRLAEETDTYDVMDRRTRTDVAFFDSETQAPIGDGQTTTQWDYTDTSAVSRVADDNGHQTLITYDTANRPSVVTDAKGNTMAYGYNPNSDMVSLTEVDRSDLGKPAETFVTTFEFDNLDRQVSRTDNVGSRWEYRYDSRSNRTTTIDARGNRILSAFDGLDRLLSVRRELTDTGDGGGVVIGEIVTTQGWDDSSRLIHSTDDNGNMTREAYDPLNRPIVTRMADGTLYQVGSGATWPLGEPQPNLTNFVAGYDVHDNRTRITDANGSVVTGSFDLLNRLPRNDIVPGPGVSADTTFENYRHDGLSRLVQAEDDDSRVGLDFDSLSRVIRETQGLLPGGPQRTVSSTHDGESNRTRLVYPGGRAIVQAFDSLDRPTRVEDDPAGPGSLVANYSYIGPGRVERRDYGNNTRLDVGHDGIRRVIGTRHTQFGGAAPVTLDDRSYTWDREHNKTTADDNLSPPESRGYGYDSVSRLIRSQKPSLPPTGYHFDGVGNRTVVTGAEDAGLYILDPTLPEPADSQVNQYTQTPFDGRSYDANGNPTSTGQKQLLHDYRNRLTQLVDPGTGQVTTYRYDCLGRRTEKNESGSLTRFYHAGLRVLEEQDPAGLTLATFVWGGADELLQMERAGQKRFFHEDELGSIRKVTHGGGVLEEQYEYADYGVPSFFGPAGNPIPFSAIRNPYLFFTGRRFDAEGGFYWSDDGYVDPRAGRFLERVTSEPWEGGTNVGNPYMLVGDNPTSLMLAMAGGVDTELVKHLVISFGLESRLEYFLRLAAQGWTYDQLLEEARNLRFAIASGEAGAGAGGATGGGTSGGGGPRGAGGRIGSAVRFILRWGGLLGVCLDCVSMEGSSIPRPPPQPTAECIRIGGHAGGAQAAGGYFVWDGGTEERAMRKARAACANGTTCSDGPCPPRKKCLPYAVQTGKKTEYEWQVPYVTVDYKCECRCQP